MSEVIYIAADHAGFDLKAILIAHLPTLGYEAHDLGCFTSESVDYPDFAKKLAKTVAQKQAKGILICGTGIGMAITANKTKNVRAASVTDIYSLLMARQHNDLNVLCLGARVVGEGLAKLLVDTFLTTRFEAGRHVTRVQKMED